MSFGFFEPGATQYGQIYTLTGIDAKTVGDNLIFTTANEGKSFLTTRVFLYYTTVSGYSSGPSINVGNTAVNFDNIVQSGSFGVVSSPGLAVDQQLINNTPAITSPNTGIYLRVATGAAGTTMMMAVALQGFYLP